MNQGRQQQTSSLSTKAFSSASFAATNKNQQSSSSSFSTSATSSQGDNQQQRRPQLQQQQHQNNNKQKQQQQHRESTVGRSGNGSVQVVQGDRLRSHMKTPAAGVAGNNSRVEQKQPLLDCDQEDDLVDLTQRRQTGFSREQPTVGVLKGGHGGRREQEFQDLISGAGTNSSSEGKLHKLTSYQWCKNGFKKVNGTLSRLRLLRSRIICWVWVDDKWGCNMFDGLWLGLKLFRYTKVYSSNSLGFLHFHCSFLCFRVSSCSLDINYPHRQHTEFT